MKKVSILDLPEDLLDDDTANQKLRPQKNQLGSAITNQSRKPSEATLDALITEVANMLGITPQELNYWAKETKAPEEVLRSILRAALRFKLNPLLGQIDWEGNLDGSYEVYITIDGWIAMIHREPSFKGLAFDQSSDTEQGIPVWMECSIYHSGFAHPITVREYYAELKTNHPMWLQMPRRMLRHKTLQQCARLAFGISVPELKLSILHSIREKQVEANLKQFLATPKSLLRQKLYSDDFQA